MNAGLRKYPAKLVAAGLCAPGEPLLAVRDDLVELNAPADPRTPLAHAVLTGLGAGALLLAEPVGACQAAMAILARRAVRSGLESVTPGDCETRTFLHDLPVVAGSEASLIISALRRRKGCIVLANGRALMAAHGAISPEQPFVTASSMAFACFVAYFSGHLRALREQRTTPEEREEFARVRALLDADLARLPQTPPDLAAGPFADEDAARAAMIEAGRAVVEHGLVDSSFGNVSCRQASPAGELLLISQTGSSLDELAGCIDPCRMDGSSCVGLTASSEYSAHKAIYDGGPARTILHGHPRFAVILSMDCERLDCPGQGQCHRSCATPRCVGQAGADAYAPIVPGEVGTGPFGLCNTLPPAMNAQGGAGRGVIVYGHGLFTTGAVDYRDAFQRLRDIENHCRDEYFRRVDRLCRA